TAARRASFGVSARARAAMRTSPATAATTVRTLLIGLRLVARLRARRRVVRVLVVALTAPRKTVRLLHRRHLEGPDRADALDPALLEEQIAAVHGRLQARVELRRARGRASRQRGEERIEERLGDERHPRTEHVSGRLQVHAARGDLGMADAVGRS